MYVFNVLVASRVGDVRGTVSAACDRHHCDDDMADG